MKKDLCVLALLGGLAASGAAANDGVVKPTTIIQSAGAIDFNVPTNPIAGGGVLYRTAHGVQASGAFADLDANSAYTAWWFIVNQPDKCTAPCDEDDLIAGLGQVFYAGGFITDAGGKANAGFSLGRGGIPVGADRFSSALPILNPASEVGLRRPLTAQIAIVARNHGPIAAGSTGAQLGSYFGGCAGHGGAFNCFDQQILVFPKP